MHPRGDLHEASHKEGHSTTTSAGRGAVGAHPHPGATVPAAHRVSPRSRRLPLGPPPRPLLSLSLEAENAEAQGRKGPARRPAPRRSTAVHFGRGLHPRTRLPGGQRRLCRQPGLKQTTAPLRRPGPRRRRGLRPAWSATARSGHSQGREAFALPLTGSKPPGYQVEGGEGADPPGTVGVEVLRPLEPEGGVLTPGASRYREPTLTHMVRARITTRPSEGWCSACSPEKPGLG